VGGIKDGEIREGEIEEERGIVPGVFSVYH
jgi:hypothetical protein